MMKNLIIVQGDHVTVFPVQDDSMAQFAFKLGLESGAIDYAFQIDSTNRLPTRVWEKEAYELNAEIQENNDRANYERLKEKYKDKP